MVSIAHCFTEHPAKPLLCYLVEQSKTTNLTLRPFQANNICVKPLGFQYFHSLQCLLEQTFSQNMLWTPQHLHSSSSLLLCPCSFLRPHSSSRCPHTAAAPPPSPAPPSPAVTQHHAMMRPQWAPRGSQV